MVWIKQKQKILRRGGKNTQNFTEKILMTDNHDDVIIHLVPDILECEVKWALGSIMTNKASGGDGIPVELFQILKAILDDKISLELPLCCDMLMICLFALLLKPPPRKAESTC